MASERVEGARKLRRVLEAKVGDAAPRSPHPVVLLGAPPQPGFQPTGMRVQSIRIQDSVRDLALPKVV